MEEPAGHRLWRLAVGGGVWVVMVGGKRAWSVTVFVMSTQFTTCPKQSCASPTSCHPQTSSYTHAASIQGLATDITEALTPAPAPTPRRSTTPSSPSLDPPSASSLRSLASRRRLEFASSRASPPVSRHPSFAPRSPSRCRTADDVAVVPAVARRHDASSRIARIARRSRASNRSSTVSFG